jgi:peptidyl-prolyl cis-trans isomerase SurA
MNKYFLIIPAVCAMLFGPGVPRSTGASVVVDRVVAVVNDEIITLSDLQREDLKKSGAARSEHMVLEDLIDRKLQLAAAKRSGVDVTDPELAEALTEIMKRNSMDRKQFDSELAKDGLTYNEYRSELREQITLSRVFNKYVRSGLILDEAELRAYYERNQKLYAQPEEIRVRQIFIRQPDNASPSQTAAVKERARTAYERARTGEDFVSLVRELSESENAAAGGDLGFMRRDHALPEIEQATRSLKHGEIAGPLSFASGYHIIRLEEVRTPVTPFDRVKDEIQSTLYQQKLENTYRTWLQTLRSDSHIENRL